MVTRAIFVLLSALAGMALFLRAQDPSREFLLMGLGMGAVAGGLILAGEYALRRLSFGIIVGGAVGLAGGLILTGLVEWVGSAVFDVETFLFHIGGLVFLLGLPYLGLAMGARFGNEQFPRSGPGADGSRGFPCQPESIGYERHHRRPGCRPL
jgi:hypothetical protein